MDTAGQRRRRALRAGAGAILLAAVLVGCGGDDGSMPPNGPQPEAPGAGTGTGTDTDTEETVVVISDFSYAVPDSVPPGSTLVVRNEDAMGHSVTSDVEGVFDVVVPAGEEVTFTVPEEPGEYPFHCTPHPTMTGTLVVG